MEAIETIEMIDEAENESRTREKSSHGEKVLETALNISDDIFKRKFRMSKATFHYLVNEVFFIHKTSLLA